jgi:Pyridoxamine 5'-phosphate oxidase
MSALSSRSRARMSDADLWEFVAGRDVVICSTLGRDGWPHAVPLSFVVRDGTVWAWSFAKAQKVRNLERDPRCTLMFEHGVDYDQMRGAMLRCEAVLHRDHETVGGFGRELVARYGGGDAGVDVVDRQAGKRVAVEFVQTGRRVTWDHRKLTGRHGREG